MPGRGTLHRLLAAQGINGFGDGLWFSMWAIYFTRVQHIPAQSMGLAIGLGGLIGLLSATPLGVLAERRGPREVLSAVVVVRGLVMVAYMFVGGFWSLLVVASLFASAQTATAGIRVAFIYGLMPAEVRLKVLAQSRVVQHIAYALGAAAAALVLGVGTRPAFVAAILVNAATFFVTAAIFVRLPHVSPVPLQRRHRSTQAVRDLPYLALMACSGAGALCWSILSSGLPLWIASDTTAGVWTAATAVAISSVLIAVFQVPVSQRCESIPAAVRAARICGLSLALCCALFAFAAVPAAPLLAELVLLAGLAAHVVGELYYVASRWSLSLGLMMRDAEGQYQGVAASTEAVAVALGPAIVTALVAGLGGAGWIVLGVLLGVAALPIKPLAAWALRDRGRVATAGGPALAGQAATDGVPAP